jgi:endoribonuclease LACTB2
VLGGSITALQDLAAYMQSLRRLRTLPNLPAICPGHGPIIDRPVEWIDEYIEHREERERQIVGQLSNGEALTSWQIMERIYTDLDPRLRRMADRNVRSHLDKLAKEGRIREHAGKLRTLTQSELAERQAEQRERAQIIRTAEESKLQERRRALMLQEDPPMDEWLEPPRFELA